MDKSLSSKAIDIKGKQYVLVSDRIIYFNETYPEGSITTKLVSPIQSELVVVKATVRPENSSERKFTAYSQAKWGDGFINKSSALENCETSAVGRALAMMGIGVIDSVASVDEINKAGVRTVYEDDLSKAKQKVYKAFEKAGTTDTDTMKAVLMNVLKQETIDSVADAELVIEHLEAGSED